MLLPSAASVKAVVLDFEFAMWKVVRRVLPTVTARGCAFHWEQAVWRKCQKLGLQMCSYAALVGFRAETLQDTKSIFTMHTGKGVRVVGSLQQW